MNIMQLFQQLQYTAAQLLIIVSYCAVCVLGLVALVAL